VTIVSIPHIAHIPIPRAFAFSGVSVVVRALVAEHARRHGVSTVVADLSGGEFPGARVSRVDYRAVSPDRDWTKPERATDAALGLLGRPRRYAPRMFVPAAEALRAVGADVILVHEGHYAVTGMPLLAQVPRSRAFLYVHIPISRAITRRELLRLLGGADGVVAVSEFMADQVSHRLGRGGPPISVVPNGVDLDVFAPPAEPVRNSVPQVVFAGRVDPGKGVDRLVDASVQLLAQGVPHRLTVVGRDMHRAGRSDLSPFEQSLRARAAPAGPRIRFLPFLDPPALSEVFGQADVVCVPSVVPEPFGLVALEAMACEAAVLVSTRGALPEVVGDAGWVCEPETATIAAALEELLVDERRREDLARAGATRSRAFSWGATHRRLLAVLDDA
jgi:glycosyltransferase involved in cell wall biosynthesis